MTPLDEKAGMEGRNLIKGATFLGRLSGIRGRTDDKGDRLGGMGS
jgi:hypothetical protein